MASDLGLSRKQEINWHLDGPMGASEEPPNGAGMPPGHRDARMTSLEDSLCFVETGHSLVETGQSMLGSGAHL